MRKTFRKFRNDYLSLSANIRNGILIVLVLIGFSLFIPLFYSSFIHKTPTPFTKEEIKLYDSLLGCISYDTLQNREIKQYSGKIQAFDPNKISTEEWVKLGLDEYIAKRIARYTEKGGRFKVSDDVLKIYGFDTSLFLQLEPYMVFLKDSLKIVKTRIEKRYEPKPDLKFVKKQNQKLEINGADSVQLTKLYGIGPAFASRIIKYRDLLGGFYSINQLKEVYGINDSVFQVVSRQAIVDSFKIIKLDLQTVESVKLQKHPYIGKYKARLIVNLRKIQNEIAVNDLIINNILTEAEAKKLYSYLKY